MERALIEELKGDRIEEVEVRERFQAWARAEEEAAEQVDTTEAHVMMFAKRMALYFYAGFSDEAMATFESLCYRARQMGMGDLLACFQDFLED